MSAPLLTVGMATFNDLDGVLFSIQALRLYHAEVLDTIELLVVDNQPNSAISPHLQQFLSWMPNARYIPSAEVQGTAAPRNRVFAEAQAPYVVCMDSHVLLTPGSLAQLIAYYQDNPTTHDLLSGPLIYDNLESISTHFNDDWGGEMWGRWATDPRGVRADAPPFEIKANGLGLFSCRKDAWLGFNPQFRGFGGEEHYIHEKFRRAGAKCLCLPFLRWWHRFARPSGVPYSLTVYDKVRNYVIGHKELSLDLTPVYQEFVASGKVPLDVWNKLVEEGEVVDTNQPGGCGCGQANQDVISVTSPKSGRRSITRPGEPLTLEGWYEFAAKEPSDINEHVPTLRSLASQCQTVTELGGHIMGSIGFLMGQPKELIIVDRNRLNQFQPLSLVKGQTQLDIRPLETLQAVIDETDMLLIRTKGQAQIVYDELAKHAPKVKRWIVLHNSVRWGEQGEGGGPGILPAIRRYVQENPVWTVIQHDRNNNGLLILSRDKQDKKDLPALWKQGWNALKASVRAGEVVGYGPAVGTELQESRLAICTLCPSLNNGACAECGCPVDKKTSYPTEFCPLGHWHQESA